MLKITKVIKERKNKIIMKEQDTIKRTERIGKEWNITSRCIDYNH